MALASTLTAQRCREEADKLFNLAANQDLSDHIREGLKTVAERYLDMARQIEEKHGRSR